MVAARDTDVLVLMIAHVSKMNASQLWMRAGTANRRRYMSINVLNRKIPVGAASQLLAFHALTGCDTTSYFSGHIKRTAYKVFKDHHVLLDDFEKKWRQQKNLCANYIKFIHP